MGGVACMVQSPSFLIFLFSRLKRLLLLFLRAKDTMVCLLGEFECTCI